MQVEGRAVDKEQERGQRTSIKTGPSRNPLANQAVQARPLGA